MARSFGCRKGERLGFDSTGSISHQQSRFYRGLSPFILTDPFFRGEDLKIVVHFEVHAGAVDDGVAANGEKWVGNHSGKSTRSRKKTGASAPGTGRSISLSVCPSGTIGSPWGRHSMRSSLTSI